MMWVGVPPSSQNSQYAAIRSSAALPGWADTADPTVDSARAEFEAGRFWHSSEMLREHAAGGAVLTPSEVLLLARADAGWKNWAAVLAGLEGADWLDGIEGGEGRLLLARSLQAAERWDGAAEQYARFRSIGALASEIPWAASREAQVAARAGLWVPMLTALDAAGRGSPELSRWTVLQLARNSLEEGDAEQALRLLPLISGDSAIAEFAWDLEARAWLVAGDTARALDSYDELAGGDLGAEQRGETMEAIGAIAAAGEDRAAAHAAYGASLEAYPRGASGTRAAWGLLQTGTVDAEQALRSARILDQARENHQALEAYERHLAALPETVEPEPAVQLARTRLLSAVGRHEAAVAAISHTERVLAYAAELGAGTVYAVPGADASGAAMVRYGRVLAEMAERAQALGMKLCVEHFPGLALSTVAATLEFLSEVDHPNLYLLFDLGHAQMGEGEDPAAAIESAGPRLGYVHLDDNDGEGDLHWSLLDGVLTEEALGAIFTALGPSPYTGPVSLELNPNLPDPATALNASRNIVLPHLMRFDDQIG